jgi:hypothetical protein
MSILIIDSESLRKIESDEYDIIDMRGDFYFSNVCFYIVDMWRWSSHPGCF